MQTEIEAPFTVVFRGLKVQCDSVEHVVEAIKVLAPLEREVAIQAHAEPESERINVVTASPIATAVYDLYREAPTWRRPIEIVKALRKRKVAGAKYTTVYAVLRYGDFVKREGRWNVADAAA